MRWWFVAAVCLTGCDFLFTLKDPPSDVPSDAPTDGPPPPPIGCSPTTLLVDDFTNDGPVRRPWIFDGNGLITNAEQAGGELVMNVMNGTVDVKAEAFLDLRENRYSVTVRHIQGTFQVGDVAQLVLDTEDGRHRLSFGLEAVQDDTVRFDLVGRYVDLDVSEDPIEIDRRPYDATIHKNIAIDHIGSITRFLVANDDLAFGELFANTVVPFDWIGFMRPRLFVSAGNELNTYRFDRFNGGGEPSGSACPIDTLVETFQNSVSSDWQTLEDNCAIEFDAAGDLRMTFGLVGMVGASCELQSSTYYDLRGRSLYVLLKEYDPQPTTNAAIELFIETRTARASFIATEDNQVRAIATIGGADQLRGSSEFGIPAQQFWRFREAGGGLAWETSADNVTYMPFGSIEPGMLGPLDVVRVVIRLVGRGGASSRAEFGGFNDAS
jgi:hypothetical protein